MLNLLLTTMAELIPRHWTLVESWGLRIDYGLETTRAERALRRQVKGVDEGCGNWQRQLTL